MIYREYLSGCGVPEAADRLSGGGSVSPLGLQLRTFVMGYRARLISLESFALTPQYIVVMRRTGYQVWPFRVAVPLIYREDTCYLPGFSGSLG